MVESVESNSIPSQHSMDPTKSTLGQSKMNHKFGSTDSATRHSSQPLSMEKSRVISGAQDESVEPSSPASVSSLSSSDSTSKLINSLSINGIEEHGQVRTITKKYEKYSEKKSEFLGGRRSGVKEHVNKIEEHENDKVNEMDEKEKVDEMDEKEKVDEMDEKEKVDEMDVNEKVNEMDENEKVNEMNVNDKVDEMNVNDKVDEMGLNENKNSDSNSNSNENLNLNLNLNSNLNENSIPISTPKNNIVVSPVLPKAVPKPMPVEMVTKKPIKFTVRKVSREEETPKRSEPRKEYLYGNIPEHRAKLELRKANDKKSQLQQNQQKYDQYVVRSEKIEKEIRFLANLLPPYNVEIDYATRNKITRAIEKLRMKKDEIDKKKYSLGISISRLWREYDENSTWVRTVSNQ